MTDLINEYYSCNARKLRTMIDKIICVIGGISDKDLDDFYSIGNEVFVEALNRFDPAQGSFEGYLRKCLSNRIKSELSYRNREKRDFRRTFSLDISIEEDGDCITLADMIPDGKPTAEERIVREEASKADRYLKALPETERKIAHLIMAGKSYTDIAKILSLTKKEMERKLENMRSYEMSKLLLIG